MAEVDSRPKQATVPPNFCIRRRAVVDAAFAFGGRANRPQFALIRYACRAYGLEMIEGAGYEADDVIASLALEVWT